jgi:hypothetical protein
VDLKQKEDVGSGKDFPKGGTTTSDATCTDNYLEHPQNVFLIA